MLDFLLMLVVLPGPAIVAILLLTIAAIGLRSHRLAWVALVLSLPSALYMMSGEGLVRAVGLTIPVCLGLTAWQLRRRARLMPVLLLIPVCFSFFFLGTMLLGTREPPGAGPDPSSPAGASAQ